MLRRLPAAAGPAGPSQAAGLTPARLRASAAAAGKRWVEEAHGLLFSCRTDRADVAPAAPERKRLLVVGRHRRGLAKGPQGNRTWRPGPQRAWTTLATYPVGGCRMPTAMSGCGCAQRRIMLGMTLQQLAELIGVTYQQAQKYETGLNRLAAGLLWRMAQALGVEVDYFFAGLGGKPGRSSRPGGSACCRNSRAASWPSRTRGGRRCCATSPARLPPLSGPERASMPPPPRWCLPTRRSTMPVGRGHLSLEARSSAGGTEGRGPKIPVLLQLQALSWPIGKHRV